MSDDTLPDWWKSNQQLRQEMDLSEYEPPKFSDGTYTHEVVTDLELEYDIDIQFRSINPKYPEDWDVLVNRVPVLSIGRYRNKEGNTIYEISAEEFKQQLEDKIST